MQLNITTDYAIRTVLYLASCNNIASASEISEHMQIPQTYISVLTKQLRSGGIINSERGASGGYSLKRKPEEISLKDIIDLMETTSTISRCLDKECSRKESCDLMGPCSIRPHFEVIQKQLDEAFSSISIAKMAAEWQQN